MKRTSSFKAILMAAALIAVPGTAYAANVSSGNGNGEQHVTTRYNNGAQVTGNLRTVESYIYVYYAGLVDWGHFYCSNADVGRYTSNTNSLAFVSRGGRISALPGPGCGDSGTRVASKVCRDISYAPDSCGSWSARY